MPRLLVVDDEPKLLKVTVRMLRRQLAADWEFVDLTSSVEAIQRINFDEPFDVVVTDFNMPGMSGDQVVMAARRRDLETVCVIYSGQDARTIWAAQRALPESLRADFVLLKGPAESIVQLVNITRACRSQPA